MTQADIDLLPSATVTLIQLKLFVRILCCHKGHEWRAVSGNVDRSACRS
jgi:hypothetical protein